MMNEGGSEEAPERDDGPGGLRGRVELQKPEIADGTPALRKAKRRDIRHGEQAGQPAAGRRYEETREMARSGQDVTQRPQARHWSALGV